MTYTIRPMQANDIDGIIQTFAIVNKTRAQFERYWQENIDQKRITLIAVDDTTQQVAGYSNVVWHSDYAPFAEAGIPEINDMHVIDAYQRQGIATGFIKRLEQLATEHDRDTIGIGFGLTPDYGHAQRLYPKLGYIPDGRGTLPTEWGDVLYLTKALSKPKLPTQTFVPSYPIRTNRLILRPFELGDIDDVLAYQSMPEVVRYMYWQVRDRAEVTQVVKDRATMTKLAREGDRLQVAVVLHANNKVIGEVVLMYRSALHQQCELGYAFNPAYQGQGYAREAAEAMLVVGFRDYGLHRIFCQCDARNIPSYQLMERLGMRREAHLIHDELFKGEWADTLVYAMLREEWLKRYINPL